MLSRKSLFQPDRPIMQNHAWISIMRVKGAEKNTCTKWQATANTPAYYKRWRVLDSRVTSLYKTVQLILLARRYFVV